MPTIKQLLTCVLILVLELSSRVRRHKRRQSVFCGKVPEGWIETTINQAKSTIKTLLRLPNVDRSRVVIVLVSIIATKRSLL